MTGDNRKVSFLLDVGKYEIMEGFAHERGPKYPISYIFIEAVDDYIRKRQNPQYLKDAVKQVVREDPTILNEAIAYEVRELVQIELRKILGK